MWEIFALPLTLFVVKKLKQAENEDHYDTNTNFNPFIGTIRLEPMSDDELREAALDYHRLPTPGKISVKPTTSLATQRDLSLAYSPGVAIPCLEIEKDPLKALDYTSRGNIVAVISNGTAVLGLGDIGALASKPVMEGKSVLFKKFANIDSFDIEIDEKEIDAFVECVARMEPSFGGINLEDIKAPECFEIERRLRERMKIPSSMTNSTAPRSSSPPPCSTGWNSGKKITDVKLVITVRALPRLPAGRCSIRWAFERQYHRLRPQRVVYKGRARQGPV